MNLVVLDVQGLLADCLSVVLGRAGHRVVAVTTGLEPTLEAVRRTPVDVCVIDASAPGSRGLEHARQVASASPSTRTLVIKGSTDARSSGRRRGARAVAVVSVHDDVARLVQAVEGLRRPGVARAPEPVDPTASWGGRGSSRLTPRELQVLELLVEGRGPRAIAAELGVTYATARTHVQHVLRKLGAHSQREAVAIARRGDPL